MTTQNCTNGAARQLQPKVVQMVKQHVSYEFIWIRKTCDYRMFTVECCLVGSGLRLGLDLVSGW